MYLLFQSHVINYIVIRVVWMMKILNIYRYVVNSINYVHKIVYPQCSKFNLNSVRTYILTYSVFSTKMTCKTFLTYIVQKHAVRIFFPSTSMFSQRNFHERYRILFAKRHIELFFRDGNKCNSSSEFTSPVAMKQTLSPLHEQENSYIC